MSLVAYDGEITDSEDEQEVETNKEQHKILNVSESSGSLFVALPSPTKKISKHSNYEEEDDEFLKKKAIASEEIPKPPIAFKPVERKPARIILPSLSEFDDEEDEVKSTPKFKPSVKGTGLLSLLPLPKAAATKDSHKKMIPRIISKKPDNIKSKVLKPVASTLIQNQVSLTNGSSDESDGDTSQGKESVDFFSFNEPAFVPDVSSNLYEEELITNKEEQQPIIDEIPASTESVSQEVIYSTSGYLQHGNQQPQCHTQNSTMGIDNETLRKLCGSRARHKGETMQIIDIDQKEIMPDPREWLTKALTEDNSHRMSSSKRRGDEPTTQQRKKHQITYLAHQAKANEQDLQNQWANNRLSKKQTQSKYGF